MTDKLKQKKIAIVATDGFEQAELSEPLKALKNEGATVDVIAPGPGQIQGMQHHKKGDKFTVDRTLEQVKPQDYDALVLPGGVANPDTLRIQPRAIAFIRHFVESGKPIAAICHGPWTLIDAGGVKSKRMTSWPSLKTDLINAGADWVDQMVVVDNGLVTSRKPSDLPQFCAKMIEEFAEGRHTLAAQ
ncbi:MAG TPA: type 1 glutamine amidotransferase domain-containing protein [Stellaceae bacterium]|nr:type 1 glutamine amidotransferase domain-containing protein [Stellaceae bacterium]